MADLFKTHSHISLIFNAKSLRFSAKKAKENLYNFNEIDTKKFGKDVNPQRELST